MGKRWTPTATGTQRNHISSRSGGIKDRLVRSGPAKRDIGWNHDVPCDRVGPGAQEDCLTGCAGRKGRIYLRRRGGGGQGGADRRSGRDAARNARCTPVNGTGGIENARPELGI